MRRDYSHAMLVMMSGGLLMLSTLTLSAGATTSAASTSFLLPTQVVTDVGPDLHQYKLQRIGIISFVNLSGTPDAGTRVADFFFAELDAYQHYELVPAFRLDDEMPWEFIRMARATPEEDRSRRLQQFVRQWIERRWSSPSQQRSEDVAPRAAESGSDGQSAPPVDAVVTGVITRYDDRKGNAFLVDQPASVAYEAYLISTHDGAILWRVRFDETQKPLLDNLLLAGRFFRGGGGWQTHDTLTRIGLERVVKTFPGIAGSPLPSGMSSRVVQESP